MNEWSNEWTNWLWRAWLWCCYQGLFSLLEAWLNDELFFLGESSEGIRIIGDQPHSINGPVEQTPFAPIACDLGRGPEGILGPLVI